MTDSHHSTPCDCAGQPPIRQVNGTIESLFPGFEHVDVDAAAWKALLRCPACRQMWSVDEWDKYQIQLVVKVADRDDWRAADEAQRKSHLERSRGGVSDAKCMWNDCCHKQLKGSAYCVEHLFATGVRS